MAVTFSDVGNISEEYYYYETEEEEDWPLYIKIIVGILLALLIAINLVGNTCTILSFIRDKRLRTVTNYYILNLAIADISVGLVSLPFYAVYTILYFHWPFGYKFCKVWNMVDFLVCAESSLTIILISHDRFQMVHQGVMYHKYQTKSKAITLIVITWSAALLLYGPAIIGYDSWRGYSTVEQGDCDVEFATEFIYTLVTSLIEFLVPLTMVTIFNALLYINIRKRTRVAPEGSGVVKTGAATSSQLHGINKGQNQHNALHKDRKAAQNLSILVVVYLICWIPYVIATVIFAVCEDCVNEDFYEFANWLLWSNSSINSLLYAYTNERFRNNYKIILCAICNKCQSERKVFAVKPMPKTGKTEVQQQGIIQDQTITVATIT